MEGQARRGRAAGQGLAGHAGPAGARGGSVGRGRVGHCAVLTSRTRTARVACTRCSASCCIAASAHVTLPTAWRADCHSLLIMHSCTPLPAVWRVRLCAAGADAACQGGQRRQVHQGHGPADRRPDHAQEAGAQQQHSHFVPANTRKPAMPPSCGMQIAWHSGSTCNEQRWRPWCKHQCVGGMGWRRGPRRALKLAAVPLLRPA